MIVHVDLYTGIAGFTLACLWNGIKTILFVEIDKYCQKVLRKHFPGVPIVEDIRDVEKIKEIVANAIRIRRREEPRSQQHSKRSSNDGKTWGIREGTGTSGDRDITAILITAGFPCQPFSVAGKRQGEGDDRYLWPETLAVIEAIKPKWVLLENVTGIINLALDTVLSDLEGAGYAYETLIIPACAVNAWHRRDRIWIVAHSNQYGKSIMSVNGGKRQGKLGIIADSARAKDRRLQFGELSPDTFAGDNQRGETDWWAVEPELGRVAHGIPHRVDRLKCLGNAIVPQVAYEIIKVIKEIEER